MRVCVVWLPPVRLYNTAGRPWTKFSWERALSLPIDCGFILHLESRDPIVRSAASLAPTIRGGDRSKLCTVIDGLTSDLSFLECNTQVKWIGDEKRWCWQEESLVVSRIFSSGCSTCQVHLAKRISLLIEWIREWEIWFYCVPFNKITHRHVPLGSSFSSTTR